MDDVTVLNEQDTGIEEDPVEAVAVCTARARQASVFQASAHGPAARGPAYGIAPPSERGPRR